MLDNKWITVNELKPEARYRLFCFPYAGGASSIYNNWNKYLPADIELFPIELPGRGRRISEPPIRNMNLLIRTIVRDLLPYFKEKRFMFFGHSMGAILSYELTNLLLKNEGMSPEKLFVSAHRAPHVPRVSNQTYNQSDETLIQKLKELNGTADIILNTPELLDLVLPIMRADLELCETYKFKNHNPLTIPITAFAGDNDKNVLVDSVRKWDERTTNQFNLEIIKGDHFFINDQTENMVEKIVKLTSVHNYVS
ncbi:thioesterase domain-containing protein (plasmid) [Pseudalkalibacillus hwajinpoensis]|uniref:thioesterase II family protein n=1 Tax=Guptibacillus hwajinpoensis TaxID=208199 RepID=UPI00325BEE41